MAFSILESVKLNLKGFISHFHLYMSHGKKEEIEKGKSLKMGKKDGMIIKVLEGQSCNDIEGCPMNDLRYSA